MADIYSAVFGVMQVLLDAATVSFMLVYSMLVFVGFGARNALATTY